MNVGMRSSVCTLRHRGPPRRRSSASGLRSVMETQKKRRSSERSCPPTALSLPVGPNGISAHSVTKRQLIKMLHRSLSGQKAGKERRARAKNSHQPGFPQPGKKRIGAEYAIETDPLARSGPPISEKATI